MRYIHIGSSRYEYYGGSTFGRFLKHTLLFVYSKTVVEWLHVVMRENCYGCEVDCPILVQY
jgi:hypothetical protein